MPQTNSLFALSFSIVMLIIAFLALTVSICFKTEAFIWANYYHCSWLDIFFTYYTNAGDGLFCCLLIVGLWLFKKRETAYKLFYGFVISSVAVCTLKALIKTPRPKALLPGSLYHHFIQGVTHSGFNSFLSGHTTTAFVMAAIFASTTSSPFLRIIFLVLALGVGYSRIYLGQHFVEDVLSGIVVALYSQKIVELIYPLHVNNLTIIKRTIWPLQNNESGIEL